MHAVTKVERPALDFMSLRVSVDAAVLPRGVEPAAAIGFVEGVRVG